MIFIAPKHISAFTPEEYYTWVSQMYAVRTKGKKITQPVAGITVSRTKTGKLSVRRSTLRSFPFVTWHEIETLGKHYGVNQSELWNMFKQKKWIVAKDRMEAECTYAQLKEIPW